MPYALRPTPDPPTSISLRTTLEHQASRKNAKEKGFECIWVTRHASLDSTLVQQITRNSFRAVVRAYDCGERRRRMELSDRWVEHYRMDLYDG
ncbi:hypothetical protein Moror_4095 [Moniliophthora roreri MCA 2997]|uniref:Uncharacterized protein n=1 Tax=Moniliophthora roreri (strain MCA 2997) TaxID=1381753 RepID=V2XAI0_MONRO|nr:hypothetical protein Moror_4095 [Moniliophthora roreri MCA 2997]